MAKRDLRQMKKTHVNKDSVKKAAKKAKLSADIENVGSDDIASVEDTISKYENKSEGELMGDLEGMIRQGKKDGTFTDEMLEAFMKNVAPMMDKDQRKKMRSIADMIKSGKL